MKNISEYLDFAIKIAKEAGSIQMKYFGNISSLEKKSTNIDLVTKADLESENYLIKQIHKKYKNHSIIAEESGLIKKNGNYTWTIDPLDGTTNFAHKLPIFAVSLGLVNKKNETVCAVVYNPAAKKCFYAQQNRGSYLNGKPIKCTSSKTLSECLIVTGFPYLHDKKYDLSFEIFKRFYDLTRGLRRLGSASLDLCFVAMGRFDGYYEFGLKTWDVCAGSLIVKEAGGLVTDWNNKKQPKNGKRILASNGKIHQEMINILNSDKEYQIFYN